MKLPSMFNLGKKPPPATNDGEALESMAENPPLIRWVDLLLYGMVKRCGEPVRVVRSQPLPLWPEHEQYANDLQSRADGVPVDFDHVANRLKVLSQLNPGSYTQPVKGKIELRVRGRPYWCHIEFDDTAADPYFVLTMVEGDKQAEPKPPDRSVSGSSEITTEDLLAKMLDEITTEDLLAKTDEAPLLRLVDFILNEASKNGATSVRLTRMEKRLRCEYEVGGTWREVENPPLYLWTNIANMLTVFAGLEYWRKGPKEGIIRRQSLVSQWRLTCENQYNQIVLRPIIEDDHRPEDIKTGMAT